MGHGYFLLLNRQMIKKKKIVPKKPKDLCVKISKQVQAIFCV